MAAFAAGARGAGRAGCHRPLRRPHARGARERRAGDDLGGLAGRLVGSAVVRLGAIVAAGALRPVGSADHASADPSPGWPRSGAARFDRDSGAVLARTSGGGSGAWGLPRLRDRLPDLRARRGCIRRRIERSWRTRTGRSARTSFPTAIESDRAIKIGLLEQLKRPPAILILGSSRSRPAAPRYLQRLTGHTGFNAGVTGGDTADEWVFAHLMAERFPGVSRRYLIFINVGIGGAGVNPQLAADALAQPYLTAQQRSSGESLLHKIADYLSVQATTGLPARRPGLRASSCSQRWFHADGSLLPSRVRTTAGSAPAFSSRPWRASSRRFAARPESRRGPRAPTNLRAFARLITWMDAQGATPVVVMNPLHPALLRALERHGGFARHTVGGAAPAGP